MISSWETSKANSKYHFDNFKNDPQMDRIIKLGHIDGDWSKELKEIIDNSKPATWKTRGYKGEGVMPPREDLDAEEYDLEKSGYGKDYKITHINWKLPPVLKQMSDLFGLKDCMERIHVQMPGEVWNLHIDKLSKWNPEQPYTIMRIMIQLTDWEQGHFWSYGNHIDTQWRAGDVSTFDWQNLPHCTANAGHNPRVTLQLTGVITEKTTEFLSRLKRFDNYTLNLSENSWF
jgi:hypothetical protein